MLVCATGNKRTIEAVKEYLQRSSIVRRPNPVPLLATYLHTEFHTSLRKLYRPRIYNSKHSSYITQTC